ncbi:MAG: glycosyltransferase family 4 protein [Candidatus Heimdallarchaeota archaeon]
MVKDKPSGVILLSFEFPPRRLSKTSDQIADLANYLANQNVKTWIITFDDWRADIEKLAKNITIIRIPNHVPNNITHLSTIMNLKPAYQSAIANILHERRIDLIHLFEWTILPALIPWEEKLEQKLIFSTSSLQKTRDASASPYNDGIKVIEKKGVKIMDKIIAESKKISEILVDDYEVNPDNVSLLKFNDKKHSEKVFELYKELI